MELEEKYNKGVEVINSIGTPSTIFENIKPIVSKFIKDEEVGLLDFPAIEVNVSIMNGKITGLYFTFGECWHSYEVRLGPLYFIMYKQEGHSRFETKVVKIETYKLL